MRIHVTGEDELSSAQARAYAEYRLFAALARHTSSVRSARVTLRLVDREGAGDSVACAISVSLEPSGDARTMAIGSHAYAAINRAVDRIADLMRKRTAGRVKPGKVEADRLA